MQNTQCCAPFELPSLYREILSLDSSRLLRRQGIVLFEQMRDALYLILMGILGLLGMHALKF